MYSLSLVLVCLSTLSTFTTDSTGQLNILRHNRHSFCMDSAQVGVFEQTDQISFRSFLIRRNREIRITITNIHSRRMVKDGAIVLLHTCNAPMAALWKRKSVLKSWAISRTKRWNGSLRMSNSVDFWYRRISRKATVPGR